MGKEPGYCTLIIPFPEALPAFSKFREGPFFAFFGGGRPLDYRDWLLLRYGWGGFVVDLLIRLLIIPLLITIARWMECCDIAGALCIDKISI